MYRDENRDIVYLDESWINKNIAPTHTWLPDEKCESALDIMQNRHVKLPKFSSGKGARLIILHAGSCKTGFLLSTKLQNCVPGYRSRLRLPPGNERKSVYELV